MKVLLNTKLPGLEALVLSREGVPAGHSDFSGVTTLEHSMHILGNAFCQLAEDTGAPISVKPHVFDRDNQKPLLHLLVSGSARA